MLFRNVWDTGKRLYKAQQFTPVHLSETKAVMVQSRTQNGT